MTAEPWTPTAGQSAKRHGEEVHVRALYGMWAWVGFLHTPDAHGQITRLDYLSEWPPPPNRFPNADPVVVERFRAALMVEHDDWDMETVSEAAHICADADAIAATVEAP